MNEKELRNAKIKKHMVQYLWVALGVCILDIAFYFFLSPTNIVLGGMMGLSIILEPYYTQISSWFTASVFLLIANTIALIIGGVMLGKDFFFKTIFSSLFSPLLLMLFENIFDPMFFMRDISSSGYYIIALLCGTALSGLGLGLALKNNGSTGGMDVIQKIMSKYLHVPYSKTMYLTDWVIVVASGFVFVNGFHFKIEMVVYGILGVLGTAILIDMITLSARSRRTAYIITTKPLEVRDAIYEKLSRGVTFVDAFGGYTAEKKTMLICTMEKNESYRLRFFINEIDPDAFSFITSTKEIFGEYEHRTRGVL